MSRKAVRNPTTVIRPIKGCDHGTPQAPAAEESIPLDNLRCEPGESQVPSPAAIPLINAMPPQTNYRLHG